MNSGFDMLYFWGGPVHTLNGTMSWASCLQIRQEKSSCTSLRYLPWHLLCLRKVVRPSSLKHWLISGGHKSSHLPYSYIYFWYSIYYDIDFCFCFCFCFQVLFQLLCRTLLRRSSSGASPTISVKTRSATRMCLL